MKKVLFSVAVVSAFAFASCGGPSVCDCVNAEGEPTEECEKMEKEWKAEYEEADEDRQKEMMEEIQSCEKDAEKEEGSEE